MHQCVPSHLDITINYKGNDIMSYFKIENQR